MSWTQRLIAGLFVAAAIALVVVSLLPHHDPPVPIQAEKAKRAAITRKVTAAGKLQAATEVKVSSNLSGDLLVLTVQEGDTVKKGQLLAQIDSRRYGAQVQQQSAMRKSAMADFELERVQVTRLTAEAKRVKRLFESTSASAVELERAEADLAAETARMEGAKERIAQATAALAEASHMLELTTIVAPIDGVVTQRAKQVGERVRGSDFTEDVIVVISTLSAMEAKVEVGEHEVVYLHEGDKAEVEIDAIPDKKFPAQVVEIARIATVKNPGTEAEVISFPVRLTLTEAVPGALPGMSAQATISTDTHEGAVVIPIQAVTVRTQAQLSGQADPPPDATGAGKKSADHHVTKSPMKKVVFVMDKGVAKVHEVETGLADENEIEILSGVAEGDLVIEGPYKVVARELKDDKAVKVEEPHEKRRD